MCYSFDVRFRNNVVVHIKDINDYNDDFKNEVANIAKDYEKDELRSMKYGIDLKKANDEEFENVINFKNEIMSKNDAKNNFFKKTIRFSEHSKERVYKRLGSQSASTFINIVDIFQEMDIINKVQWKGYPQLSYTFSKENDSKEYKISASFVFEKNKKILIITVSHINTNGVIEDMESRISDNPQNQKVLMDLKSLLKGK